MADNKLKLCPKRLMQMLAFTTIASIALIITGIVFCTFPRESVHNETTTWSLNMDYTDCLPLNLRYNTCEDFFTDPHKQTDSPYCQCLVDVNTTATVPGNDIHVYCQLEYKPEITTASINTLKEKSNNSEQCDPYIFDKPSAEEACEAIPDTIFNDEIKLQKQSAPNVYIDLGRFEKSARWNIGNDYNKVTVSMVSNWTTGDEGNNTISPGSYRLMLIKYTQNKDIHARTVVFSSQSTVSHVVHRSNAVEIAALVLGVLLLAGSIAAIVLRKRILGIDIHARTVVFSSQSTVSHVVHRSNAVEIAALVLGVLLLAGSIAAIVLRKRILGIDIHARTVVFSSQSTVSHVVHRSNAVEIAALVLGVLLLAGSIAAIVLRKRILGIDIHARTVVFSSQSTVSHVVHRSNAVEIAALVLGVLLLAGSIAAIVLRKRILGIDIHARTVVFSSQSTVSHVVHRSNAVEIAALVLGVLLLAGSIAAIVLRKRILGIDIHARTVVFSSQSTVSHVVHRSNAVEIAALVLGVLLLAGSIAAIVLRKRILGIDIHARTVVFSSQSTVSHVVHRSNAVEIAALVLGVLLLAGSIAAIVLRKRILGIDIHARTVVFSSQSTVSHVVHRSNAVEIAALVLGVLLLAGSIAAIVLRKRILGQDVKNETLIPAAALSNTQQSRPLPEKKLLSSNNA